MQYQVVVTDKTTSEPINGLITKSHTEAIRFAKQYKKNKKLKVITYLMSNDKTEDTNLPPQ